MTNRDLAIKASLAITQNWESIPARVARWREVDGLSDGAISIMEENMRDVCGGEELYEASKKFLTEQGIKP